MAKKTQAAKKAVAGAAQRSTRTKPVKKSAASMPKSGAKLSARRPGKTVDQYVAELEGWQKECLRRLRQLIREAAPKAIESIKWGQPVYEHNGPFAWIKAHTHHVSCGFWRGSELTDPNKLLEGTGNKMRHVKFAGLNDICKTELQDMVRTAVKLNEALGNPTMSATRAKK